MFCLGNVTNMHIYIHIYIYIYHISLTRCYVKSPIVLDALSQYPRPHQLCWSDQGIGTAALTSTKYSQVAAGLIQKVSRGTLKASSLRAAVFRAVVLRAVVLRSKIIAIVNVMCY